MSDAAVRERQHAVGSPQALSLVPAATGLKLYVSALHAGSFVSSFWVQTPIGAAYRTEKELLSTSTPSGVKGFKWVANVVP